MKTSNLITRTGGALITLVVVGGLFAALFTVLREPVGAATLPGYGDRIYFHSSRDGNNEIYVMNPDGTEQARLTNNAANDSGAFPSPDGTKVVFTSDRDGNNEIYVMNADGTEQVRLTNTSEAEDGASWSPDGSKIIFHSHRDGDGEIYVMNADGSEQTNITNTADSEIYGEWSADGTKIVFRGTRSGNLDIYTINTDGTDEYRITTDVNLDTNPSWSPDGSTILFARRLDGNYAIFLVGADGESETQLTQTGSNCFHPRFSPHGDQIFFTCIVDGNRQVHVMDKDGTNQSVLVASAAANNEFPVWSSRPNLPPVISSDALTTSYNSARSIDVLANDTDEETLDPANLTLTTQPSHGTATIHNGQVRYTPYDGYLGEDELEYQVCDSFELDQKCATGVLGITVQAGPTPATPTISNVGAVETDGASTVYADSHRPTFSGTAAPGTSIRVEINSDPIVLTTTADAEGNWSVTPNQDIPDGEHTVTITATKDGATSEPLTFVLGINIEQIPMTGTSATAVRLWGMALLAGGIGLQLRHRRQPRHANNHVPPLFS